MSEALFFEFKGVTADEYRAVNAILKLDPETGDGAWPPGLLNHIGAAGPAGDPAGPPSTGAHWEEPVAVRGH